MSKWYKIVDPQSVDISDDGETIEINFDSDYSGNIYVEVSISIIRELLEKLGDSHDRRNN